MPHRFGAPMVERARVLVETSPRTLEDIAVLLGASVPTLRNWIMKYGWRRHPGAPRATRKLPPQKEGPARRVYEGRAGVGDLAVLLGCHESYVHRLAKQRGWQRAGTPGKPRLRPPNPALLASADEMGDPRLTSPPHPTPRTRSRPAADRGDREARGGPRPPRRASGQDPAAPATLRDGAPPPAAERRQLSPEEEAREQQAIMESIARRLEKMAGPPADPAYETAG